MQRKSSSNVHGSLVEKLWVEIGTRFIFQTRTYTNPRLPIVWQIGGICLSMPSVVVALHLCLQITKAGIRLLQQGRQ